MKAFVVSAVTGVGATTLKCVAGSTPLGNPDATAPVAFEPLTVPAKLNTGVAFAVPLAPAVVSNAGAAPPVPPVAVIVPVAVLFRIEILPEATKIAGPAAAPPPPPPPFPPLSPFPPVPPLTPPKGAEVPPLSVPPPPPPPNPPAPPASAIQEPMPPPPPPNP